MHVTSVFRLVEVWVLISADNVKDYKIDYDRWENCK